MIANPNLAIDGQMSNDESFDQFEALLNAYMKRAKMKDTHLSDAINSKTYINKIRSRRSIPGFEKLEQIAHALGCTVADLTPGAALPDFDGDSSEEPQEKPRDSLSVKPEKHEANISFRDWSGELNSKRFQRFARPLIDDILGDEALIDFVSLPQKKKLSSKEIDAKIDEFFEGQAGECRDWLTDGRESSPEISVTSHLTQFLLVMLGIIASLVRPDQKLEYSRWKKAALQTAQLLLESPQARHKSG